MAEPTPPKEFILVTLPFPDAAFGMSSILEGFKKRNTHVEMENHEVQFIQGWKMESFGIPDETWKKTTILITLTVLPPNLDVIPNLKLIHLASAGANHLSSSPIWKNTSITLTNSSGVHGPQIAEWVLMQILNFNHKNKLMMEWQKEKRWGKHTDVGFMRDCVKQRLGVLGYGAIGRQTARIAKAMGMDIIACTASPRTTAESKKDTGYIVPGTGDEEGLLPSTWYSGLSKPSLHNFLSQDIDILLLSLPLTPSTTKLLGAQEFEILGKKNAFIVNIARGGIVDQEELIKALKKPMEEGGLRGAALDVTDPEPLPESSELWDMENVSITPHVSGLGVTYAERVFEIVEANVGRFAKGEELINVVDKEKGY